MVKQYFICHLLDSMSFLSHQPALKLVDALQATIIHVGQLKESERLKIVKKNVC